MVEHDATADGGRRVNIHPKGDRDLILQVDRQCLAALHPQPMADAVRLQGMETFQVQQRR
ncbi:hypothetical protein D3C78_1994660 [compost metagenome]